MGDFTVNQIVTALGFFVTGGFTTAYGFRDKDSKIFLGLILIALTIAPLLSNGKGSCGAGC